jgi:NAD/NADP transhydrogenase beta subunit
METEPAPSLQSEVAVGVGTAMIVALLGAPIGLLWAAVAPKVEVVRTSEGLDLVSAETKSFVGADGWFLVIGLIVGLLCGVLAWQLGRNRPLATVLGLAVGGVVAALIAWRVGHLVDVPRLSATLKSLPGKPIIDPTLDLRAKGVVLAWPFAAVAAFLGLIAVRPGR